MFKTYWSVKRCPVKGFKQVQVNNLRIRWDSSYGKFTVISPDGRKLEEFDGLSSAKRWAETTHDFIRLKTKPKRKS